MYHSRKPEIAIARVHGTAITSSDTCPVPEHKDNEQIDEEISGYRGKQDKESQRRILELERKKIRNKYAEEVAIKVNSLPSTDTYEKVIKYEKAIQRSILQNLALLKRLQSMR